MDEVGDVDYLSEEMYNIYKEDLMPKKKKKKKKNKKKKTKKKRK
jgi:thiamine pyrophosphokinase